MRKNYIIPIIALLVIITVGALIWYAINANQKYIELLIERNQSETLKNPTELIESLQEQIGQNEQIAALSLSKIQSFIDLFGIFIAAFASISVIFMALIASLVWSNYQQRERYEQHLTKVEEESAKASEQATKAETALKTIEPMLATAKQLDSELSEAATRAESILRQLESYERVAQARTISIMQVANEAVRFKKDKGQ